MKKSSSLSAFLFIFALSTGLLLAAAAGINTPTGNLMLGPVNANGYSITNAAPSLGTNGAPLYDAYGAAAGVVPSSTGSLTVTVGSGGAVTVDINLNHQNIWESGQTFGANILLDGTNNIAPNQTLTGSGSILNEGLGDGRYSPLAGSSSITTLGSVTAGAIPLGLVTGIDASVAAALPNSPSGGSGVILLTDGDGTNVNLSGNSTVTIATRAYTADSADAYIGAIELTQIDGLDSSNITPLEFGINTASGFVTQTGGDARYFQKGDTIFAQTTTDISQTGTTLTDTSLTLTLTPGTYVITAGLYGSTASTTGGVYLALSGNTGDTFQFIDQWARGTSVNSQSPIIYPHFGSGATHLIENTGDAPDQYVTDNGNGRLTVATTHAYAVQLAQWSAEDDTNPAILKAGSWIKAVRQ